MLRINENDGALGESGTGVRLATELLEPSTSVQSATVLLNPPKRSLPERDRRATGRFVQDLGHLLDAAAVGIPLLLSSFVEDSVISVPVVLLFVVVATGLLWPTHRRGLHVVSPGEALSSVVVRLALAPVVTWALLMIVRWSDGLGVSRFIDVVAILQIMIFTIPLVLIGRVISYWLSRRARTKGYDLEDTLILGSGPTGLEIAQALTDNPAFGLVPCGFIDGFEDDTMLPLVGRPGDLPQILKETGIHNVVIAFGAASEAELVSIVRRCHDCDVSFYVVPRLFELGISKSEVGHEVDGLPLVRVQTVCTSSSIWPAKRAFDLITSGLLTLLMMPVFLGCALAVKLTSSGPVFFKQVRIGIGGKPFEILKFRTMTVNDDSNTQWSVDEDDRVTAIGKLLRPSHLDELPQLLNVLRGDMSLVGPRPERPHFVEQFSGEIDGYEHRHRVPVGITGWAQVNGFWGDTSMETRVRLDNRYIENWSIWRDLVIALRTFPTLFGKRR